MTDDAEESKQCPLIATGVAPTASDITSVVQMLALEAHRLEVEAWQVSAPYEAPVTSGHHDVVHCLEINALHQLCVTAYRNPHLWPNDDVILHAIWTYGYDRPFSDDVSTWPLDASIIFQDTHIVLVLGSIASSSNIAGVNEKIGQKVDVVLSMNDDDPRLRGEPVYEDHYAEHNVIKNLRYGGLAPMHLFGWQAELKKAECLARWRRMAVDLQMVAIDHFSPPSGPIVILVHCSDGMNRSAGALCALLIIFRKMTAKQAIETLVAARPGLSYWQNQRYFLEALFDLQVQVALQDALCVGSVGLSGPSGVTP